MLEMKKRFVFFVLALSFTITFIPVAWACASEVKVSIKGQQVDFYDQGSAIMNGRTLIPVRAVFEALGFIVAWNPNDETVTLTKRNYEVIITIGKSNFTTNGIAHTLDVPAQVINNRTMLPIRAILERVGYHVDWNPVINTVIISDIAKIDGEGFIYDSDIDEIRDSALSQNRILNNTNVDYLYAIEKLEDLENLAELLVRATITADSKNIIAKRAPGYPDFGFTRTNVEVIEVFKGDAAAGDIIGVLEPYYIGNSNHIGATNGGKDYFSTYDGYLPSIVGQEYIFFIILNDRPSIRSGYYDLVNLPLGRYPVLDHNKEARDIAISSKNSDFCLTDDTNTTVYRNIFAEVHQKYVVQPRLLEKESPSF